MRLLIALAFFALASAVPELKPIQLPAAALPTVAGLKEEQISAAETTPVKVVDVPTADQATPEAVKIRAPTFAVAEPTAVKVVPTPTAADEIEKVNPVKVVDAPNDIAETFQEPAPEQVSAPVGSIHVQQLPHSDPEAMQKMYPKLMSLVDIGTLFVPEEVMRQVAEMAEQDTNAENVGGPHPFSFNNAEPLDSIDRVNVVDSPVNQLNSRMDPVVVVESLSEESGFFAEMPKVPETVKVVDINQDIPVDMVRPVPKEMWRGPQIPTQLAHENWDPSGLFQNYRPRPAFYRDMPIPNHNLPYRAYNDPMLR